MRPDHHKECLDDSSVVDTSSEPSRGWAGTAAYRRMMSGIVKLTGTRENTFHFAGIWSRSEAHTSHFGL
jgi:hypothetical protein